MKPQIILPVRIYCNFSIEERKSSLKLCRNFPQSHSFLNITFLSKSHFSKCFIIRCVPGHLLASVHFWHLHDVFQSCAEMHMEQFQVILVRGNGVRCLSHISASCGHCPCATAIKAETSLFSPFAGLKLECVI